MRGDRQNHTRSPCRPVTHLLSQNSPLSKMADYYKREAWALSTSTLISTEEVHFHGGGSFLRRKLISTEEAHFYGGSSFLRRRLISTEEVNFEAKGLYLYGKQEQLHRESKVLIRNVFVLQCAAVAPVGHRTSGRWAVAGRGPWRTVGRGGPWAAGRWAAGRWAAGLLLAKPL